jgi:hypothetical protein
MPDGRYRGRAVVLGSKGEPLQTLEADLRLAAADGDSGAVWYGKLMAGSGEALGLWVLTAIKRREPVTLRLPGGQNGPVHVAEFSFDRPDQASVRGAGTWPFGGRDTAPAGAMVR